MHRRCRRWLGILAVAIVIGGAPAAALAGPASDSLLELASGRGPSLGLGFGVAPLHWELIAPPALVPGVTAAESAMAADLDPGRAVSLDFKLRWPGAEPITRLEPYVVLGPALFVDRPHDTFSLVGIPADPVVRVGARAGAGFNWRLTEDSTLFGSYDFTTTGVDGARSPDARSPATSGMNGYDILYGIRFRY